MLIVHLLQPSILNRSDLPAHGGIRAWGETSWKISRTQTLSQTYIRKSRFSRIALPQQTGMIVSFAKAKRLRNPRNAATSREISPHQLSCCSSLLSDPCQQNNLGRSPRLNIPAPTPRVVNSTSGDIFRQAVAKSRRNFWPDTCAYYYGAGAPPAFRTLASSRNSFGWPRLLVGSRLTVRMNFPASLLAKWIAWSSGFHQMLTSNVTVLAFFVGRNDLLLFAEDGRIRFPIRFSSSFANGI